MIRLNVFLLTSINYVLYVLLLDIYNRNLQCFTVPEKSSCSWIRYASINTGDKIISPCSVTLCKIHAKLGRHLLHLDDDCHQHGNTSAIFYRHWNNTYFVQTLLTNSFPSKSDIWKFSSVSAGSVIIKRNI